MSIEEVEEYQKMLEEWSWSAKTQSQRTASAPKPAPVASSVSRPRGPQPVPVPSQPTASAYQEGAILCLDGRSLAIYRQPVPTRQYHLTLVLMPNGSAKAQGIALEQHRVEELGCLPPDMLERVQRDMRWNRDLLVFHCYSFDDVMRLPQQLVPPASGVAHDSVAPAPSAPSAPVEVGTSAEMVAPDPIASITSLKRGQRLQVRFGDKAWYAVYWGRDDQGQVVAHKTHREWQLMHLDLERFGTDLVIDPNPDREVVAEIEESLTRQ